MECIACGAAEFSTWASVGELRIMRCLRCGLGVTVPRPSPEQLARNNAGTYSAAAREEMYSLRSAELAVRYVRQLEAIKRFSGGKRLLDVGCSIGMFTRAAAAAGFDDSMIYGELSERPELRKVRFVKADAAAAQRVMRAWLADTGRRAY